MDDDLGIRGGAERMSLRDQTAPQFLKVIYLPVINDPYASVLIADRLIAGIQIDNGETEVTQSESAIIVGSLPVRTAMSDSFHHPVKQVSIHIAGFTIEIYAADTAH